MALYSVDGLLNYDLLFCFALRATLSLLSFVLILMEQWGDYGNVSLFCWWRNKKQTKGSQFRVIYLFLRWTCAVAARTRWVGDLQKRSERVLRDAFAIKKPAHPFT